LRAGHRIRSAVYDDVRDEHGSQYPAEQRSRAEKATRRVSARERLPPSSPWRRAGRRFARLLCILVFSGVAPAAHAHPAPFSYLDLRLETGGTTGSLVIHDFDAAHELGIDDPQSLLAPSLARERSAELTRILDDRLRIVADARPATLQWQTIEVLAEQQSLRFEFSLANARDPGRIEIDALLFPYDATHQTFINVYERGRLERQAILSAGDHELDHYSGSAQGRFAVVRVFVAAGVEHILIGPDHLLFLLGLLLLGGSLWRLTTIVTAFTLGHSVTLSLAVLDVVRVPPALVEPAIALSIVVVGVDNLLVRKRRAREPRAASFDLRPGLAAAFGLIHGFGFATVLREIGLPAAALGWSLAAFNIGVELGQLAAVAAAVAVLAAVRRYDVVWAKRCELLGSVGVIAAGLYWFVQRLGFGA
jgi:hydrogenase/urease accessory protein HupE